MVGRLDLGKISKCIGLESSNKMLLRPTYYFFLNARGINQGPRQAPAATFSPRGKEKFR